MVNTRAQYSIECIFTEFTELVAVSGTGIIIMVTAPYNSGDVR